MSDDPIEQLARELHEVYQQEAKRQNDTMYPANYDELLERVKNYDRALARHVLENFVPKDSHRIRSRRKGEGAYYADRIVRLNVHHRRLLFYLLVEGAVYSEIAVPMVHLKRKYRLPTGPTAGRMAELIGKGYVKCHRVPITFQPDSEGILQYRPATELDPDIGMKKRRKFTYWLTQSGREALHREIKKTDDFVRAMPQLDVLLELREKVEKTEVG